MTTVHESIRDSLKPLKQLENERDNAYHCFLLWCLQEESLRSIALIARSTGMNEATVRVWKKKYGWSGRSGAVPGSEIQALQLLRARMSEFRDELQVELLKSGIDAVLEECAPSSLRAFVRRQQQGIEDLSDTAEVQAVQAKLAAPVLPKPRNGANDMDLGQYIRDKHLTKPKVDMQIAIIDGAIMYIADAMKKGEVKVSLRDLPPLLKARALLTGMPTDNINVNANVEVEHVESYRVKLARQKGGSEKAIVSAIREDMEDIGIILGAIDGVEDVVPVDAVERDRDRDREIEQEQEELEE